MLRWLVWLVLVALTLGASVPVVAALATLFVDSPGTSTTGAPSGPAIGMALVTAGASALIGGLATVLAWPVARVTARAGGGWGVFVVLPLLVPIYLVPGAWRTLLDPTSAIGSWLLEASIERGFNFLRLADQSLAIVGLAIWASPIAWIILHLRLRSLGAVIEAMRLGVGGAARREIALANLCRGAIVRAIAIVGLVMLAQTVPFDLAQIETISNGVRVAVSLGRTGEAWVIASPVLAVALGVGVWLAWARTPRVVAGESGRRGGGVGILLVLVPVVLGVVLPMVVLAGSMRDLGAIERFVRRSSRAIGWTVLNASVVGALALVLGGAIWIALREHRRAGGIVLGVFAAVSLVPGVLLGAAVASAVNASWVPAWLGASSVPLWAAHLGRYGVVACLGAMWLRAIEPAAFDDLHGLRGPSARGWFFADLPRLLAGLVGVSLGVAALSVHEIEAAVLLQPVGTDGLARFMLELLHYQRRDDLGAGVLLIGGVSLVLAVGSGILISRGLGANSGRSGLLRSGDAA